MGQEETTTGAYTVKQVAEMAGVSVRTLHYYHEIGLLEPSYIAANGYRHYTDDALLRLQQILFYREMDFSLSEIAALLDDPAFDVLEALYEHRQALRKKARRLQRLIETVEHTIHYVEGERDMSRNELFDGFTPEEEAKHTQEAATLWGEEVRHTAQRWESYSKAKREQINAEGKAIYTELAALLHCEPGHPQVQAIIARWHQHLRYFYEPSVERLRGLGGLYVDDPRFAANIGAVHPDLPAFLREAITVYCDTLEDNT